MNTSWNVTDSGYSFQKTDSVDKQKWEWLTGELEMLYSEGKALYLDSCYVIPHDTASSFSEGKRHLLGLPPVFRTWNLYPSDRCKLYHSWPCRKLCIQEWTNRIYF